MMRGMNVVTFGEIMLRRSAGPGRDHSTPEEIRALAGGGGRGGGGRGGGGRGGGGRGGGGRGGGGRGRVVRGRVVR
jgi:hypothetical protein